ncbi:translation initiation factor IF-3 [Clostridium botulinum]|uniref:Translation initiation factor IF-3 n=1 Tax=Clostridium botulinum TaxID=1491 RepID=A0AAU8Z0G4_CLOBO|nr:translation initiation factor IF-3 [Clostridium botulinum]NFG04297.1 translation initiation factor IF-3 [Clostridium sporogenes]
MLSVFGLIFLEVKIINKNYLMNEQIREKEVRLVGSEGEQLGVVSSSEAQKLADEKELDLVLIAPTAKPPVCKIMNYGKFVYEQTKKDKEAKKNQKVINIKEVRLSPTIEAHDIEIKANNARKFLNAGNKVKVTVRFRGREADYSFKGNKILNSFYEKVEELGVMEKAPKLEGRNMIMILAPRKA